MKMRRGVLLFACAVFALTAAFWWRSTSFGFVNYDDDDYIANNPNVLNGYAASGVAWAFTDTQLTSNWHPLTYLSHMTDAQIASGERERAATVSHVHNVLLHSLNAALLFLLVLVLVPEPASLPAAALFALLWALHPLRAEVVCWVSERKELLSVCLMLVSLLAYLRPRRSAYGVSLVAYALALMAKPVAVGFPAILFVLDYPKRLRRIVPFVLLSVAECAVTLFAQQGAMDRYLSFPARVINAFASIGVYVRQTVWPSGLHVLYRLGQPTDWPMFALGVLIVLAATVVGLRFLLRRRDPVLALMSVWCLVCLVPMLGVIQVGAQAHADRYTYWVGCGLVAGLAMLLSRRMRTGHLAALSVAVVAYAVFAQTVAPSWRDTRSLYSRVVAVDSGNDLALSSLAQEAMRDGDVDTAIGFYRRATTANPGDTDVRGQLALTLAGRGTPEDIDELQRLVAPLLEDPSRDTKGLALEAIGLTAMRSQDWDSAAHWFTLARRYGKISSASDDCAMRLAMCRYNAKRWADAAAALKPLLKSDNPAIVAKARELLGYLAAKGVR